jgi:hypothetical protein
MNPRTVTARRISRNACCQPRLPVTANVAVRGNIVYKVILPGSTSSRKRNPPEELLPRMWQFAGYKVILLGITGNPPEEWLFRRELLAQGLGSHRRNGFPPGSQLHGRGIHQRNGILPGITSSWMLIHVGKIKMREKSSKR